MYGRPIDDASEIMATYGEIKLIKLEWKRRSLDTPVKCANIARTNHRHQS